MKLQLKDDSIMNGTSPLVLEVQWKAQGWELHQSGWARCRCSNKQHQNLNACKQRFGFFVYTTRVRQVCGRLCSMLSLRDPSRQRCDLLTTPTSQKQVFMACHSGKKGLRAKHRQLNASIQKWKACLLLTFHWPQLVRSLHLTFNYPCASQWRWTIYWRTLLILPLSLRLNNDHPPKRCLCPKPQNLWICYFIQQKGLCRCD